MNNATKQCKKAMKIFDRIRFKNKGAKEWEVIRDIQKAIKAVRRTCVN